MSTDDADSTEDERDVELSSLAAIFPEIILEPSGSSDRKARLDIEVNLHRPLRVSFAPLSRHGTNMSVLSHDGNGQENGAQAGSERMGVNTGQLSVSLQHLPSLSCCMTLPKAYPENAAPVITLACDPPWLSDLQITRLEKHAIELWEEYGRSVMLFDYLDWLGQAAENAFDVAKGAASNILILPRTFEAPLLDFDLQAKKRKFAAGTFDCGVCLEPKKGSVCHQMSQCGHVFCKDCLKDYYNNCITEGDVSNVKCMAFGCEKERLQKIPESRRKRLDLTIKPSELAEIPLEHEKIQRFVHLKQKKELESSGNAVFCPRKWCRGAARAEKKKKGVEDSDSEPEDTSKTESRFGDRLAICSECGFAFCRRCLKGPWHGEHVICRPPRNAEELTEEEKATEKYLSAHSARCPTCATPVQKTMGCNHMVCELCRTHFCYLCQAYLLEGNPYAHFNTLGQGCYQRLWVLEGGDDENAELAERIPDDHIEPAVEEDNENDNPGPVVAAAQPDIVIPDPVIEFVEDTSSSEEDEVAPPPPPQRARGRGRGAVRGPAGGRGGGGQRGRDRGHGAARGAGNGAVARGAANAARGNIAPRGGPVEPPGGMDRAIQRFVQMALHDQEDQWDSDELDSDGDDEWVIPVRGRVP